MLYRSLSLYHAIIVLEFGGNSLSHVERTNLFKSDNNSTSRQRSVAVTYRHYINSCNFGNEEVNLMVSPWCDEETRSTFRYTSRIRLILIEKSVSTEASMEDLKLMVD